MSQKWLKSKVISPLFANLKVRCPRLKPFLNENIYWWDLPKKFSAWSEGANTPAPQPTFPLSVQMTPRKNVGWGAGVFAPSDQAEIFFERSHQYIFSFKKGFRRGHRTFKFIKIGEINLVFKYTCWLINCQSVVRLLESKQIDLQLKIPKFFKTHQTFIYRSIL